MQKKRKVIKEISTVDKTTGEIIKNDVTTVGYNAEPNFFKFYTADIERLLLLVSPHCVTVLVLCCTKMTYDGDLFLPQQVRREMAIKMRIKTGTFDKYVHQLSYAGVLIKRGSNAYIVNPLFVAKGAWTDIMKQRDDVEYLSDKARFVSRKYLNYYT